jgi:hypothetical protein
MASNFFFDATDDVADDLAADAELDALAWFFPSDFDEVAAKPGCVMSTSVSVPVSMRADHFIDMVALLRFAARGLACRDVAGAHGCLENEYRRGRGWG